MLTLKTKTVRFEWTDDDVESVVTLSSEDDEGTIIRKMRRIIALVEGEQEPNVSPLPHPVAAAVRKAYGLPPVEPPPQTGNGWAAYAPPEVPAHLEGEVELIEPGEENSHGS